MSWIHTHKHSCSAKFLLSHTVAFTERRVEQTDMGEGMERKREGRGGEGREREIEGGREERGGRKEEKDNLVEPMEIQRTAVDIWYLE